MMDLIVSWACSAIAEAFQAAAQFFTSIFGFDITEFNNTFPYAATSYKVFRDVGLAIALLLSAWQIIVFFWKGADKAPDTPIRATINTLVAIGFIYYGNYVFDLIMQFCQYPFDTLNDIDSVEWGKPWFTLVTDAVANAFSGASMLLYLIMLILICYSMVKLLLEIVERYCVTFILVYLSPMAAGTLACSTTNGIYKRYFTMFISQCLLLLLNVWCLKMACSGLSLSAYDGETLMVPFLLCYAFLRISSRMDSYINQLGLNAAITGSGLGAEIMATGASLIGLGKSGSGGAIGGGSSGNPILGAAKGVQQWSNRFNPLAATAKATVDTVSGAVKGGSEAFRSGQNIFKGAAVGAKQGIMNSDNMFSNIVTKATAEQKKEFVAGAHNLKQNQLNKPLESIEPALENMNFTPGHRVTRNEQLVNGVDTGDLAQDKAIDNENIAAWSANAHIAHDSFSYVNDNNLSVGKDRKEQISAIAKGLGVGEQSKEAGEFIKVGFGQGDGVGNLDYRMDKTGIHAEFDSQDGYRHKLKVVNQKQYDKLTTQEREGLEKMRTPDGHRYYVGTTKTKFDPLPKESKNTKDAPANNPENTSENIPENNPENVPENNPEETANSKSQTPS